VPVLPKLFIYPYCLAAEITWGFVFLAPPLWRSRYRTVIRARAGPCLRGTFQQGFARPDSWLSTTGCGLAPPRRRPAISSTRPPWIAGTSTGLHPIVLAVRAARSRPAPTGRPPARPAMGG